MIKLYALAALALLQATADGCPSDVDLPPDAVTVLADARQAFHTFDGNGDATLSGAELEACRCDAADADADGVVTESEFLIGLHGNVGTAPPPSIPTGAPEASCDGPADRPTFGAYGAGDDVIYRGGGSTWWPATVERLGDPADWTEVNKYRLKDPYGSGDYADYYDVARADQREAWWTCLFVGDWDVSLPVAATTVTDGRDLYRQWSGGMALPPLRIAADGTYLWRVEAGGTEQVIEGRWAAAPDHPGLVLLSGQDGADWTVYNATDQSTRRTFERDRIHLSPSVGAAYLTALRLE